MFWLTRPICFVAVHEVTFLDKATKKCNVWVLNIGLVTNLIDNTMGLGLYPHDFVRFR